MLDVVGHGEPEHVANNCHMCKRDPINDKHEHVAINDATETVDDTHAHTQTQLAHKNCNVVDGTGAHANRHRNLKRGHVNEHDVPRNNPMDCRALGARVKL